MTKNEKVQKLFMKIPDILLEKAVPITFKKNSIVISKGEKTEYAYFIVSGKLYVQAEFLDGSVYQFSQLQEGSIISDLEVLSGEFINAATLIASEDSLTLRIPIKLFVTELENNHGFLQYVATVMAKKMYRSSYERGNNLFKFGLDRVATYLIKNYEKDNIKGNYAKITKTREVMASEIGISIRTVNRAVQKLKQESYVSIRYGKIVISEEQYKKLLQLIEW